MWGPLSQWTSGYVFFICFKAWIMFFLSYAVIKYWAWPLNFFPWIIIYKLWIGK
jgi:hypothetical protein